MVELRNGYCYPGIIFGVNVGLACVDGVIVSLALSQLIRLQSRNSQHGWTRQKVFHLMIGSSNLGYFLYFVFALVTDCRDWIGWSQVFSFVLTAIPEIIFFATFLLLLSFWIDLCHQVNDDDEDDECTYHESLLERTSSRSNTSYTDSHRRCLPLWISNIGSRQKIVILVIISNAILMVVSAALMGIGVGESPSDPELVARIYLAIFSVAMVVLGGAFVRYGLLICLRMRRVRSERASDEMWKVGGLTAISVVCFTSSAVVSFLPDNPVLYNWNHQSINGVYAAVLLILYYFAATRLMHPSSRSYPISSTFSSSVLHLESKELDSAGIPTISTNVLSQVHQFLLLSYYGSRENYLPRLLQAYQKNQEQLLLLVTRQ